MYIIYIYTYYYGCESSMLQEHLTLSQSPCASHRLPQVVSATTVCRGMEGHGVVRKGKPEMPGAVMDLHGIAGLKAVGIVLSCIPQEGSKCQVLKDKARLNVANSKHVWLSG